MRRAWVLLAVVLTATTSGCEDEEQPPPENGPPPLPRSMAAIGDSITQAVNARGIGRLPALSWSTGDGRDDGVESHYERVLAEEPGVKDRVLNASVPGARMADGVAQARRVARERPEYVTVLFGGNDVCTSSTQTMTGVDAFRDQLRATLRELGGARTFVVSIPDVYRLWELFRDHPRAGLIWRTFRICRSLLVESNTDTDRQAVRQRNVDLNRALREVCEEFRRCRHDGGAVFDRAYAPGDVSALDFFHPSAAGQAELARVTWERSYWGEASPGRTSPTS